MSAYDKLSPNGRLLVAVDQLVMTVTLSIAVSPDKGDPSAYLPSLPVRCLARTGPRRRQAPQRQAPHHPDPRDRQRPTQARNNRGRKRTRPTWRSRT